MTTINNRPLSDFSLTLLKGQEQALCFNPMKPPKYNHWAEFDGAEAELSEPVMGKKQVELQLYCTDFSKFDEFLNFITEAPATRWNFGLWEVSLFFSQVKEVQKYAQQGSFTLQMESLFPDYEVLNPPPTTQDGTQNVAFDGVSWASLGVHLLYSARNFLPFSQVKDPWEVQSEFSHGAIRSLTQKPRFKSQSVRLDCLLRENKTSFLARYSQFFTQLIQPKPRIFSVENNRYFCHYKQTKITDLQQYNQKIYCSFELELEILAQKHRVFDTTFDPTFD